MQNMLKNMQKYNYKFAEYERTPFQYAEYAIRYAKYEIKHAKNAEYAKNLGNGQINGFARATEIPMFYVI